jgi:hypothetical protein
MTILMLGSDLGLRKRHFSSGSIKDEEKKTLKYKKKTPC